MNRHTFCYTLTTKENKVEKGTISAPNFSRAKTLLQIRCPKYKNVELKAHTEPLHARLVGMLKG